MLFGYNLSKNNLTLIHPVRRIHLGVSASVNEDIHQAMLISQKKKQQILRRASFDVIRPVFKSNQIRVLECTFIAQFEAADPAKHMGAKAWLYS